MTLKRILFLLLGLCFLASACNAAPESAAITPVATVRPTRTATSIPPLRSTFTPAPPMVAILRTADCRAGPGDNFDLVTIIEVNPLDDTEPYQSVLLGISGSYWLIVAPTGEQCWVASQYELTDVVAATLPALSPAPTPTLLTPTAAPPAVENILVKKKKCTLSTSEVPYTHYEVNIVFILEWADVLGEDGYRLYRDGNLIGDLPANTTQFSETFQLVKGGRTSTFYIIAYNVLGESRSAQFSFANPC